jgi:hypothetical protein
MKKTYLIQYSASNTLQIEARIKSVSTAWLKYLGENFLIETTKTPKEIYAEISLGFEDNSIMIVEINAKQYYGRMDPKVWEWLKGRSK